MTTSTNKMDASEVYEMLETINGKIDKLSKKSAEPVEPVKVEIDTAALDAATARIEIAVEEFKKPAIVENRYRHTIDFNIRSNWFFFSWVALVIVIFGLFWGVANQRETINQYKENDLKYRYIKMMGQTDEENLLRMERQFKSGDSIKIIRKQVEKYEDLIKEQADRIERLKQNNEEVESLQKDLNRLKKRKN